MLSKMLKRHCNYNGVKFLDFAFSYSRFLFYSTSSSTSKNGDSSSFANYLVEKLGFSNQLAGSTSSKLTKLRLKKGAKKVSSFNFATKADSVVEFLKKSGLNDSQIRIAVSYSPQILISNVEKTLKPKVDYFEKFGFSKSDFAQVVSINSYVLVSATTFIRAIETLKEIMNCDDDVISFMKKSNLRAINSININLMPNIALLRDYGIPSNLIRHQLLLRPTLFLRETSTFKGLLIRVEKELGISRDSSMFLHGINLLAGFSEKTIESKFEMFESFGWRRSDVENLIRRNPNCLALSEGRIKRSLEFLMNELGYDCDYLISHHALLTVSTEKRLVPRHKVLEALKEKGLIKKDYALYSGFILKELKFLKKFVLPFEEVPSIVYKAHGLVPIELFV